MNNTKRNREGRLEILGQVFYYPHTVWGALSVIGVITGACIIVWLVVVQANPKNLETITGSFTIGRATLGKTEPDEGRYLIQFWTPTAKTKESKNVPAWEKVESDEKLNDFAERLLKDNRVRGYRHYEVTGQGIGFRRNGAWWVVTVDDGYSVSDFVKVYQDFWKNEGAIYVEILRGGEGKHVK